LDSNPNFTEEAKTEPMGSVLPAPRSIGRLVALVAGLRNGVRAFFALLRRRKEKPGPYTILVTGASVGVGLELAKLLRATKHRVVLTARSASLGRFAEHGLTEGKRLMVLPLDVTSNRERRAVVKAVQKRWGGIDVLVNNAGVAYRAVLEHVTDAERVAQLDANYLGPMSLTRLVLPYMRSQRFGRIVNVSSVGGMTAMPTMSVYSASKYALEGASEALWYEVRPWNVKVSLVRPGFINSDGFRKVRFTFHGALALKDSADPYHAHYKNMEELVEALATLTFHTPKDVAETILATIEAKNPPLWVAGTWDAYFFGLLRRFMPASLYTRLLYAGLPRVWEWGVDTEPRRRDMDTLVDPPHD
jgi:short-subunit dehydrogenase